MEKRRFGKTDMEVTALGFGGAEIGFLGLSVTDVKKILNNALDAGLNLIDTAECYMASEELIGEAVADRRKDFYLFTKCGHENGMGGEDWSRASLARTIDRSLQRLKTDYVDLIQLHSCSEEELKRGEVIEVLERAKQAGKARYIGYSGDHTAALYAIESGRFDTLQTSISIADQEALEMTLPKARAKNMGVIAKRPIANAVWRYKGKPESDYHVPYWQRMQKLDYDFVKSGDAAQIALRFTLGIPGVHTAIVGTTRAERWRENAAVAAEGPLPAELFNKIRTRWQERAEADWIGQI